MTYEFLQQYWWLVISLLAGLLVFLMFVQGANSLIFAVGRTEEEKKLIVNSTGRKWEFTFTTLVTFGGAFFASFPLFYSTSFGGAYWVWMLILVSFVLQAVSYEFQSKPGNIFGSKVYRRFLVFNGVFGPFLIGVAVATFFDGSNFIVNKASMGLLDNNTISYWANASHGLDALLDPWNLIFGFAVMFLARMEGSLYMINNINDKELNGKLRLQLLRDTVPFLILFLAFLEHILVKDGYGVNAAGVVSMVPYKYALNLLHMPVVGAMFLIGVVLVLYGTIRSLISKKYMRGIWPVGIGTTLTVIALFLVVGYNNTAYYPSNADLQSSLYLSNSCSSYFTLQVMSVVSILVPFVLAYIIYAWHAIDKRSLTKDELKEDGQLY
ncbi:cytochrome d ubiquinol oxidase subunit II [Prevotella sp.]|uniref:cytochrome d ubiquinol oxidase subunit II n=1 Tax=Prevotella sp. TaxID=59823 RepID=UPI002648E062|nr:cytochrome d ubiquinol oxidase subunit II [Prevotella sp.]MDN5553100.1 cytochrome d ubiquinol oxidase subunit II [Prevotella sp.]